MQRVEMPGLTGDLFLSGLVARSECARPIYADQRVEASLYHLSGGKGVTIATRWADYGWEFVLLDDWEAPNLESFVFALADFEWSVILADRRLELHKAVLEFMAEAGLESHEEQALHYLNLAKAQAESAA